MTSRFFATGDTTTETESDVSSAESEVEVKPKVAVRGLVDSSSEDEDAPREVKAKKDKVYESIEQATKDVRVSLRKKDWQSVATQYAALQKLFLAPSTAAVVKASGIPKTYLRCLSELDDFSNAAHADKDSREALSQVDSKALSSTRLNVSKLVKLFAKKIDEYKKAPLADDEEELDAIVKKGSAKKAAAAAAAATAAAPAPAAKKPAVAAPQRSSMFYSPGDSTEEDADDEEEDDEEVPAAKPAAAKPAAVKPAAAAPAKSRFAAADSSDEEEEDDSEAPAAASDDDDSDSDVDVRVLDSGKITREFWLKKVKAEPAKPLQTQQDRRKEKQQRQQQQRANESEDEDDETNVYTAAGAAAAAAAQAIGLAANDEVTPAALNKRLREITALRGKRAMNYPLTIAELRALEPKAQDTATVLKIQSLVPLLLFDLAAQRDSLMSQRAISEAVQCVYRILQTLKQHPNVRLAEDDAVDAFSGGFEAEDSELDVEDYVDQGEHDAAWARRRQRADEEAARRRARVEEEMRREKASAEGSNLTVVEGNLYAYVFKISNEFYRALQLTEHTSPEYVNRLREQRSITALFRAVRAYYRGIGKSGLEARVAHLWIEWEYYYYNAELDVLAPANAGSEAASKPSATVVDELAETLYRSDDLRARVRALLFQTYSWLVHNRYEEARERLLSAHVQDIVNELDLATRSLYNRVMVQLGLAAFRRGHYAAATTALGDLQQSSKVKDKLKELLGQGVATREAKEEELEEARRRVLPYHMHLSMTDLIDATSMVSAMLVEVPAIAEAGWHQSRRVVSRPFRREYQRFAASLSLNAHGDTTRDLIMRSAKALFEGDWRGCYDIVDSLRLWSFVHETDVVKALLKAKIKQEALKVFLLTYGAAYTTISLDDLVAKFELEEAEVVRVASKLLHASQLAAAWETTPAGGKCLRVTAPAVSRTQRLALQFVDKVQQFSERVEKLQDQRPGFRNYGGW